MWGEGSCRAVRGGRAWREKADDDGGSAVAVVVRRVVDDPEENGEDVRGPIVRRPAPPPPTAECSARTPTPFASGSPPVHPSPRGTEPNRPYPLPLPRTSTPAAIDFEGNWYRALRTAGPGSSFPFGPARPFITVAGGRVDGVAPLVMYITRTVRRCTVCACVRGGGGGDGGDGDKDDQDAVPSPLPQPPTTIPRRRHGRP